MEQNTAINKYYDFINMYNSILKHCASKDRAYNIKLQYLEGNLFFQVTDKVTGEILHNDSVSCSELESSLIIDMITTEFVLNHQIRYALYEPMQSDDILQFNKLTGAKYHVSYGEYYHELDGKPMMIHNLENSIFTLKIYHYKGIDERTEQLHHLALDKAYHNFSTKEFNQLVKKIDITKTVK